MSSVGPSPSGLESFFDAKRLEKAFNNCFTRSCNTLLCGGADEPLYKPAVPGGLHTLYYRHDYFSSALHEVAHWCIAGVARRQQLDFGYWYAPDGRNAGQQQAFEAVERKPQALEWFFSKACGHRFQVSIDNLDLTKAGCVEAGGFKQGVLQQALIWRRQGLPARAAEFYRALCVEFGTRIPAPRQVFTAEELS